MNTRVFFVLNRAIFVEKPGKRVCRAIAVSENMRLQLGDGNFLGKGVFVFQREQICSLIRG
jgi:hypothetical protein